MLEELRQIDTSAILELYQIKEEENTLQDRLDKMLEKQDAVSTAVFARVRKDYEGRFAALEDKARPLKEQARGEYAELRALIERMARSLEDARLAKEELEFRHTLGEFEEGEFKHQLKECEKRLADCEAELAEGNEMKSRFIDAFRSEDELLVPAPTSGTLPAAGAEGEAEPRPEPDFELGGPPPAPPMAGAEAAGAAPAEEKPVPELEVVEATLAASVEVPPGPGFEDKTVPGTSPGPSGSRVTAVLAIARLESPRPDGSVEEFPLQLGTTTVGRSPKNDVCIPNGAVSRYHAKIVFSDKGFNVYDLNSENGVWVNGERVSECLLSEGDVVEFSPGLRQFTFRGP